MLEHPFYLRVPTDNEEPYFRSRSCAELVISTVMNAQRQGWMRLHGFIVLPEGLEMVATPIRQGPSGIVAYLQAESIPLLAILLPSAGLIWGRRFVEMPLETQNALDARLSMLLLSPVASGIVDKAKDYPYSSANERYSAMISVYAGFAMAEANSMNQAEGRPSASTNEPRQVTLPPVSAPPQPVAVPEAVKEPISNGSPTNGAGLLKASDGLDSKAG